MLGDFLQRRHSLSRLDSKPALKTWLPSFPYFLLGMTNTKAREMLDSGYRMPAPEETPDEMYNLMLKCWNYEAEARPHFQEIHSNIDILFSR